MGHVEIGHGVLGIACRRAERAAGAALFVAELDRSVEVLRPERSRGRCFIGVRGGQIAERRSGELEPRRE